MNSSTTLTRPPARLARRVAFRPAAERDLAALYAFIRDANGGPEVAIGYVRRIRSFCEGLEPFPGRGVARDDIRPGLRLAHFEKRVVVAFTISPDQVRIGRIFYGGRDYVALLGEEPELNRPEFSRSCGQT